MKLRFFLSFHVKPCLKVWVCEKDMTLPILNCVRPFWRTRTRKLSPADPSNGTPRVLADNNALLEKVSHEQNAMLVKTYSNVPVMSAVFLLCGSCQLHGLIGDVYPWNHLLTDVCGCMQELISQQDIRHASPVFTVFRHMFFTIFLSNILG